MDFVQGCLYTGSPSGQTIDGCVCNVLMSTESGKLIGTKVSFQINHASHNLWDHDGCIRVRRCAGECCLSECVIERHSGLTPGVMVYFVISYQGRSNLLRIEGNLNCKKYLRELPKSIPSFKASLELSFSRIMHAHMLQRLFETSVQPNRCIFFLSLLIRRICCLLSTCGI
ncbi:uncharacterized protein TNCV_4798571 [Trichonephila clavipes]|nr:uncharacterized protein TNCV_4798571 [Trichonephila clavipes]